MRFVQSDLSIHDERRLLVNRSIIHVKPLMAKEVWRSWSIRKGSSRSSPQQRLDSHHSVAECRKGCKSPVERGKALKCFANKKNVIWRTTLSDHKQGHQHLSRDRSESGGKRETPKLVCGLKDTVQVWEMATGAVCEPAHQRNWDLITPAKVRQGGLFYFAREL